jgi:hypothetical protein
MNYECTLAAFIMIACKCGSARYSDTIGMKYLHYPCKELTAGLCGELWRKSSGLYPDSYVSGRSFFSIGIMSRLITTASVSKWYPHGHDGRQTTAAHCLRRIFEIYCHLVFNQPPTTRDTITSYMTFLF